MRRFLFLFTLNFSVFLVGAQSKEAAKDSIKRQEKKTILKKDLKPQIKQYQFWSSLRDTTYVDTTLTLKKDYKYNYLRKDDFGLMPFANMGQPYNSLTRDLDHVSIMPLFGARAKHFNYMEVEDTYYYRVPTPLTELFYKTAFEQGQALDAIFAVNTSPQFNFSIAYKGVRSLGNYQRVLSSSGNFRFTTNYIAKNQRYGLNAHIVMQDLLNQENGGLTDADILNFQSGEEDFLDRTIYDPQLSNTASSLEGKRFYLDHHYALVRAKDTISKSQLKIVNTVSFEDKYFHFYQNNASEDYFGNAFTNTVGDKVTLENFYTDAGLNFKSQTIGTVDFRINYRDINYGYDTVAVIDNNQIRNRIKTNFFGFTGNYYNTIGALTIEGAIGANLSDELKGNTLKGNINYKVTDDLSLEAGIDISSRLPNYNHLLYQSDYINYNWDNVDQFENVRNQALKFSIKSQKLLNATLDITNIDNYTFFTQTDIGGDLQLNAIKPVQSSVPMQLLRVMAQREFKLGKFALDNTVLFQNVSGADNVLNLPNLVTRNTLYYSDEIFKKALKFQAGVTFNYFTSYTMDGYDPLLSEFFTQNETELGGFPRLDIFLNAKVRQTRIFLKAEHINSSFTGYDYFAAPGYPYRDFTVRFGLVWNFFL
ncbi:putative porin [Winogradskyella maritima]|uniref:Porin n=1 Tax=Winogradskyella maritima TaxID=1517766 RepID=A0ABV8AIP3_9FLAO|nr:putative porin [Winogradskyella maritima]